MPAWFETTRQIVELAVVALLAAQAIGRWIEKREHSETDVASAVARLRRDLDALRDSTDRRRVHVNELKRLDEAIVRIDEEILRLRTNFHDLRGDVQTVLLQMATMRQKR